MDKFLEMSKEEAIAYCYENEDKFVKELIDAGECVEEATEQFNCLVVLLESDGVRPSELPLYGMRF